METLRTLAFVFAAVASYQTARYVATGEPPWSLVSELSTAGMPRGSHRLSVAGGRVVHLALLQ